MAKKHYVTFYVDGNLFGLDIFCVREINKNVDMTQVDLAPEYVRGQQNLRGQIVTVLDLGARLGLGARDLEKECYYVILKSGPELVAALESHGYDSDNVPKEALVGLLVDSIGDSVEVDESLIEDAPAQSSHGDSHYLKGVVKLDGKLLVTLNLSEVLKTEAKEKKAA